MLGWMLESAEQNKYESFPHRVDGPFNPHNISAMKEYHYF